MSINKRGLPAPPQSALSLKTMGMTFLYTIVGRGAGPWLVPHLIDFSSQYVVGDTAFLFKVGRLPDLSRGHCQEKIGRLD